MRPCEFPTKCTTPATFWVGGAHAGDWAVHVCTEHREWARAALAPWIEEPLPAPVKEEA